MTNTRSILLRVATFLSLLAGSAHAEIAATGTFSAGATPALNGMIFFATGIRTVLGQSVDLAADVGDMDFSGTIQPGAASATFALQAGPSTQFAFEATGIVACAAAGCLDDTATFAGTIDAIDDPMDVLPDTTYAFDGTTFVSSVAPGPVGAFGLNAFAPQPSPVGGDVITGSGPTTFFDSVQGLARAFEARVRFPEVTVAGTITFVAFSALPGDLPAGYQLVPELSVFVDARTAGVVFAGSPEVCIGDGDGDLDGFVDGANFPVTELRMLHASAAGQAFADVTGGTPPAGSVCGVVPTLSPFVLARTSGGGPTTTTTLPGGGCAEPIACIDAALGAPLCGAEAVNPKLQAVVEKKLGVARGAIAKATSADGKKRGRLLARAGRQLTKVGRKADAFVDRKKAPITSTCRDAIRAALDRIAGALETNPPAASARRYPIFIP